MQRTHLDCVLIRCRMMWQDTSLLYILLNYFTMYIMV